MAARKPAKSSSKKTAAPKKAAKAPAPKAAAASMAAPAPAPVLSVPYPDYPVVEQTPAILCLIVNVLLLPGVGTMIAGYLGQKPMILKGVLQLVLTFVLVGWIWSIVSGVKILKNSTAAKAA